MLKLIKKILILLGLTITIPMGLWFCGFVFFTSSILLMSAPNLEKENQKGIQGAIVLTGGTNRISKGLYLLVDKKIEYLLVSGVHKNVNIKDIMKLWGKEMDTPPCCITLGREAENTIGNALEAKKWLEINNLSEVYLITANYHMPRALLEFNHHIPDVKNIPYPIQPENFDVRQPVFWRTDFIEYNKLLVAIYRIKIGTKPIPQPSE